MIRTHLEGVVAAHGGRVWAEGKINEGATIFFSVSITGYFHKERERRMMNSPGMHYFPTLDDASIEALLDSWRIACPLMGVLALLPEAEQGGVERLQAICTRRKVALAGAVFPALIERGEFRTQGLWLMRFDEMPYVALQENLPHDAAGAARVAEQIGSQIRTRIKGDTQVTLLLLFDALVPNISTLLDELYLQLANLHESEFPILKHRTHSTSPDFDPWRCNHNTCDLYAAKCPRPLNRGAAQLPV